MITRHGVQDLWQYVLEHECPKPCPQVKKVKITKNNKQIHTDKRRPANQTITKSKVISAAVQEPLSSDNYEIFRWMDYISEDLEITLTV